MTTGNGSGAASGGFTGLLNFLDRLETAGVHYALLHTRNSIMVDIAVPGWRWEVEFMSDDSVEIERFRSSGNVETDPAVLEALFVDE